ncbi:YpzG family protein [Terrilactibacillus laevilacticus]|uniref:YpzG family protein n=1 Tax=Terrilactibacillus laevilacticus TaxID=1380157 RepID=A0ABW5PP27_9BACI|nr:YpzG family protein [Terrilactibacillus laevilacticus]
MGSKNNSIKEKYFDSPRANVKHGSRQVNGETQQTLTNEIRHIFKRANM